MRKITLFTIIACVFLIHRCNSQSVFQKTYQFNPLLSNTFTGFTDAVFDNNGNIFVTGYVYKNFKSYLIFSKLNSEGNLIWTKFYQDIGPINILWNSDSNLIIWCYGGHTSTTNQRDFVLLKIDTIGNIVYNHWYETPNIEDAKLIRTADGNLASGGLMRDSNNISSLFLMKLDTLGNVLFNYQYSCATIDGVGASQLLENSDGNFYLIGYESDSIGYLNSAIFRFDSAGNIINNLIYTFPDYNGLSYGIIINNIIYAMGFLPRITVSGQVTDAILMQINPASLACTQGMRYYRSLNSLNLSDMYHFDNTPEILIKLYAGTLKIDLQGNIIGAYGYSVSANSIANNIVKTNQSYLFVGSAYVNQAGYLVKTDSNLYSYCNEGNVTINDTILNIPGTYSLNLIRATYPLTTIDTLSFLISVPVDSVTTYCLGYVGIENEAGPIIMTDLIYPNPFTDKIYFNAAGFNIVQIYNTEGKIMTSVKTNGTELVQIDLASLVQGVYIASFKSQRKSIYQRIIKIN